MHRLSLIENLDSEVSESTGKEWKMQGRAYHGVSDGLSATWAVVVVEVAVVVAER